MWRWVIEIQIKNFDIRFDPGFAVRVKAISCVWCRWICGSSRVKLKNRTNGEHYLSVAEAERRRITTTRSRWRWSERRDEWLDKRQEWTDGLARIECSSCECSARAWTARRVGTVHKTAEWTKMNKDMSEANMPKNRCDDKKRLM